MNACCRRAGSPRPAADAWAVSSSSRATGRRRSQAAASARRPEGRGLRLVTRPVGKCLAFARKAGRERATPWTDDVLAAARGIYRSFGSTLADEERHHGCGRDLVGRNRTPTCTPPRRTATADRQGEVAAAPPVPDSSGGGHRHGRLLPRASKIPAERVETDTARVPGGMGRRRSRRGSRSAGKSPQGPGGQLLRAVQRLGLHRRARAPGPSDPANDRSDPRPERQGGPQPSAEGAAPVDLPGETSPVS